MRLQYIVPTLGLLAASATPAMAADVGGLTINGYVETVLEVNSFDEDIAPGTTNDGDPDDFEINFNAGAQLEVGYQIGNDVTANVELFWVDDNGSASGQIGVDLEQAYVEWAASEQFSVAMGKFHNHLGWEARDTTGLYRVNQSNVFQQLAGVDVTGLALGFNASEQIDVGVYIVDAFFSEDEGNIAGSLPGFVGTPPKKELGDLAVGANLTVGVEGIGVFDLDLAYDINASVTEDGEEGDVLFIGVNGEIDAIRQDTGLLFAFDLMYRDVDAVAQFGAMAMANWDFQTDTPMSGTLMLSYFEPNDDDDLGGDTDEELEIAVALLTNPTRDENFGLNFELRVLDRGDQGVDAERGEFGFFVEGLAVIP